MQNIKYIFTLLLACMAIWRLQAQACCRTVVFYEIKVELHPGESGEIGIPYADWTEGSDSLIIFKKINSEGKYSSSYLGSCDNIKSTMESSFKKIGTCPLRLKIRTADGNITNKELRVTPDSISVPADCGSRAIRVKLPYLR